MSAQRFWVMGLEPSIHPTLWGISSAALLLHSALDSLVPPLGHRGVSLHPFALQKGLFLQPVVPDSKEVPWLRVLAPSPSPCCAVLQEEQEEAWLASMPAWRRDILRKKLEDER